EKVFRLSPTVYTKIFTNSWFFVLITKVLQITAKSIVLPINTLIKTRYKPMKKQILTFALIAGMIGAITTGCSSSKSTSGSDTTKKDTTAMKPMPTDTMKKDTGMKKDTAMK